MEQKISAFEARRNFGRVLREVADKGNAYVVDRHGEAVAAVVPVRVYEQWKRERDRFFEVMEAAAKRANMNEEDAMALALEEIAAHRREGAAKK
jgi:prevent-host-death family protein